MRSDKGRHTSYQRSKLVGDVWLRPVYRDKGIPPEKGGVSSFAVTKLPHSLELKGQALITSPLPLTLELPEHDHHLPFLYRT